MAPQRDQPEQPDALRRDMVRRQLIDRGIRDQRVLDAMAWAPRERFVPESQRVAAYADRAMPIGHDQTISQPYVVAFMAEAARIREGDRVLEVGAGCGYAAAVLSRLAARVDATERIQALAARARANLAAVGCRNVHVHLAGDRLGLPDAEPFDAIVVSAAAEHPPQDLLGQLAEGGRLVVPVGPHGEGQQMQRYTRRGGELEVEDLGGFSFVPLVT